jgi:hypothetical protein
MSIKLDSLRDCPHSYEQQIRRIEKSEGSTEKKHSSGVPHTWDRTQVCYTHGDIRCSNILGTYIDIARMEILVVQGGCWEGQTVVPTVIVATQQGAEWFSGASNYNQHHRV